MEGMGNPFIYLKYLDYFNNAAHKGELLSLKEKEPYLYYMIFAKLVYLPLSYDDYYMTANKINYIPMLIGNEDACIYETPDETIIAFRGTVFSNIYNLFTIMRFDETNYHGFLVHAGFAEYARHIEVKLAQYLPTLKKPITLVGHSMGGALAALSSLYIKPAQIITFGCPKYVKSSENFPDYDITNIIDGIDIVTYLPPFWYKRVGEDFRIKSSYNPITSHFADSYLNSLNKYYTLGI
jgi:predicted lipase